MYLEALPRIAEHIWHSRKHVDSVEISVNERFVIQESLEKSKPWWRAHLIPRLTTPLVCIIELITNDCFQITRAAIAVIGGVIDLDLRKFHMAALDLSSVVVQTLVCPIFAVLSFCSPTLTLNAIVYIEHFTVDEDPCYWSYPYKFTYKHTYARRIMGVVSSIFLTPVLLTTNTLEGCRFLLLDGRWDLSLAHFITAISSLGLFFASFCSDETNKLIAEKLLSTKIIIYKKIEDDSIPLEENEEKYYKLGALKFFFSRVNA